MIENLLSKYKKTNKLISKEILYAFYNQVSAEIQSGNRNEGVWAKSIVDAEGDEQKTKAIYIKLMVERKILAYEAELEIQKKNQIAQIKEKEEKVQRKNISEYETAKHKSDLYLFNHPDQLRRLEDEQLKEFKSDWVVYGC
jgi:hypothetical protein